MKLHIPTYTPPPVRAILSLSGGGDPPINQRSVKNIEVQKIATRIRALRQAHNLTQQELAALCNFPGPWKISRLEGGKKGSGIERIDTLEVVCQELGIEIWELLKPDFVIPGEDKN